MNIFKRIWRLIFYNPYTYIKKCPNIKIEKDTVLLPACTFRFDGKKAKNHINIGSKSIVSNNFIFESDEGEISIGNNCFINGGTSLIARTGIEIGDFVTIAWGCTIYDHNSHSLDYIQRQNDILSQINDFNNKKSLVYSKDWDTVKAEKIIIKNNVWIGFDSVILNGVTIGEGAIIGARSVVRENVEPWTVVLGNPAVVVKRLK